VIMPIETTPTLPAEDFAFLSKLMHERAAIVLEPGKEYLALSRLDPLVREQGCGTVSALIERLRLEAADSPLLDLVIDALTTNETTWFRDLEPFESLRRTVLPELIERRGPTRTLAIWSAGCSTGQEPFSIAMTVREHFPELASWNLTILGTDISPSVLERARRGRYGQLEVNRGLPAHLLVKHFTRAGMEWEIEESIRRMVRFQRRNLITDWQGLPPFDLILMRNVMIYFDVESKRDVLTHMHGQLATNGYLLLGSSETTFNLSEDFQRQVDGRTAWYRPVQPGQTDPIGGAGR
jgi:chemotaxis protein methyltransferase CheR